ncbi:hypothetical protein ABC270_03640 [Curtobacterium sp. 1P10AnD]|uniref:hypothetical protein n=1 Tax=Curtobacterium sp. 1P10AnD TaxID=3132283 RepID=UPI00399F63BB
MTANKHRGYAPRSRAGLLISCSGFALLAVTAINPALARAVDSTMGFGFVVAVVVVVSLPRLIPVGQSWARAAMPKTFATTTFVASGAAALVAVTVGPSCGSVLWPCLSATAILAAVLTVAVRAPERSGS